MDRRAFFALAGALVGLPRAARATGGLDVAGPEAEHTMRVLLASGSFAPPQPLDAWHFAWSGRTYRGTFAIIALPGRRNGLLNTLPLDAYLYGVLSKEVSPSWAPGAQQAQAIVSRTYALGKLQPFKPFDIVAGESDQQYGGIESESVEGRAAVDATGGVILTYGDEPARVAYSSCCGGRTADAGDVWKTPYPYLISFVDPHCVGSPNFDWHVDLPMGILEGAFGAQLAAVGALRGVELNGALDANDRPKSIAFLGATSTFATTPAAFRAAVGASVVRSTFVRAATLAAGAASLALRGTGHGHGVGLCQWGARFFASSGASAAAILALYFPGTRVAGV